MSDYATPRRSGRKMVALECMVEGTSGRQSMRLSDIGLGGGFVDTPVQVERGDRIHVTFTIDDRELRCPARVAHVQRGIGFGFAFLGDEMSDDTRAAIEWFVGPPDS